MHYTLDKRNKLLNISYMDIVRLSNGAGGTLPLLYLQGSVGSSD